MTFILRTANPEKGQPEARNRSEADEYGEYAKLVAVTGGWLGFETIEDYETWKNQK